MTPWPSNDDLITAYRLLNGRDGGSWRFEEDDEKGALETLRVVLPHVVEFGRSPRFDQRLNTDAIYWCRDHLGGGLIHQERWTKARMIAGVNTWGFDLSIDPAGRWERVRRTYLFRDLADAVWFKMVWW